MGKHRFTTDRDRWREHDGRLTINGRAIPMHGRCKCGCPLYVEAERVTRLCVDCGAFKAFAQLKTEAA